MAKCKKLHYVRGHRDIKPVQVPCYYIAGICVVDPIHQGPMEMFLRSTFPFYHSIFYEESKVMRDEMVPNNIEFADESVE